MVISRCVIHQPRVYLAYGSEDVSLRVSDRSPLLRRIRDRCELELRAGTDNAASSVVAFAFVKRAIRGIPDLPADPRALRTKSKDLHKPNTIPNIDGKKCCKFAFFRGRGWRSRRAAGGAGAAPGSGPLRRVPSSGRFVGSGMAPVPSPAATRQRAPPMRESQSRARVIKCALRRSD